MIYDIGTGYPGGLPDWGTGEVAYMTDDDANISHDGKGHLAITPLRGSGIPEWTSGALKLNETISDRPRAARSPSKLPFNSPTSAAMRRRATGRHSGLSALPIAAAIRTGRASARSPSWRVPCPGCLTGFHTYRAELDDSVTPEEIRWYLDGRNYFTVRSNEVMGRRGPMPRITGSKRSRRRESRRRERGSRTIGGWTPRPSTSRSVYPSPRRSSQRDAGELRAAKVARTVYHGPYEGLGAAWGEFEAWIAQQGLKTASDLWECYTKGPESSSDPADFRTELNRPLIE